MDAVSLVFLIKKTSIKLKRKSHHTLQELILIEKKSIFILFHTVY